MPFRALTVFFFSFGVSNL
jgi:NAD(P)-dependent dehydrogenase (short-subunit alcohol dehydrogenase family)